MQQHWKNEGRRWFAFDDDAWLRAKCSLVTLRTLNPKKETDRANTSHPTAMGKPACLLVANFCSFLLMTATLPANREKEEKSGTHYNSTWLKYYPKAVAKSSNWQLPNVKQVPNQKKKGSNKFKQIPPSPNCTIKQKVLLIRMQWQMWLTESFLSNDQTMSTVVFCKKVKVKKQNMATKRSQHRKSLNVI